MNKNDQFESSNDSNTSIDDRIAERLAQALVFNLQITDGIQLVSSLGNGDEKDNKEAVKCWVKNQGLDENQLKSDETLMLLEERLYLILVDLKSRHQFN